MSHIISLVEAANICFLSENGHKFYFWDNPKGLTILAIYPSNNFHVTGRLNDFNSSVIAKFFELDHILHL